MINLINKLKTAGVILKVGDNNKLNIKAPQGAMTDELREAIKQNKEKIINYLRISPCKREGYLPLSYAQERLWFLDQLEPDSAGYNIPGALRISGELNVSILEQSFTHIIERHESLRTVFRSEEGKSVQVIKEDEYFHIPVTDLTDENGRDIPCHPTSDADNIIPLHVLDKAKEIADKEAATPFNLSQGPLLRAKLIKLSENEHILIINMHHIISDGWSIGILIRELGQVMNSLVKGKQPELQPLPVQYADFSVWQKQWMEAGELERQLSYWKEQLQDSPDLLQLPIDYTRPPVQTYNGSRINFKIPENLTTKINNISIKHGCTTFMTLLSAFNVLLHKLTGEEDICVGSPIANRNRKEIEGLIGFFVNTLVLRTKIQEKQSFVDLLNQVKQTTLLSYDHQDTPFEKLVEAISPERDMSYSPLFQVMMVLQNNPAAVIDLGDVKIAPFEIKSEIAKFDLTLNLEEADNIMHANIEYNTDLFKPDTISRIIKYYLKVLETITENNEIKISDIELIDDEEKHKLLLEWNDTKSDYPQDKSIHQLFEEQVSKTPDNIAVIFEDKQLTYSELNSRANKLAHTLRDKGVKPDSIVAIIAEKSIEMIVAILGVLKSGGAYLPIDPALPEERIKFMLKDSEVKVILNQEYLNDESNYSINNSNPETINTTSNLAYVIYTSGSTGIPKGVMVEHKAVSNTLIWRKSEYNFNENDTSMVIFSYVFDGFITSFFTPVISGSKVVILNSEEIFNPSAIEKIIEMYNVTNFITTPSLLNTIMPEQKSLKIITMAGEALTGAVVSGVKKINPDIEIVNEYGPTENAIVTSYCRNTDRNNISIGKPIANTQVYILDKNDKLCPISVAGELCISGTGLARGYLNRPELTAEKFVSHPFDNSPPLEKGAGGINKRMYRTGDLARWVPDGNIEYLGRIDTQVKIRGFRIECGEIENALLQHENIKESLVVPYKEEGKENILVAYIVLKNTENSIGSSDLREMLKKQLPDYMIPSFFINLDSIPLTPNGKVDRRRLPKPDKTIGISEYVSPTNETEEKLVKIWSEILKIEKIGINDNFFELGGHSLLATQVISRIREIFETEIPVKAIFESPTIEGLGKRLSQSSQPIAPEILPVSRDGNLPLSYAQERLWFLDQLDPDSAGYNMPGALRILGELNVSILEQSFTHITERHENLRTVFKTKNGKPVQVIKDPEYFHIPVTDLTNETEKENKAKELAIADAGIPFNLSTGPLLRAKLVKLKETEYILIVNMHHIISDGWSMGVLIRELGTIMNSLIKGDSPNLTPLPVQYADFSVWQRQWMEAGELDRQLSYWKKQLADSPDFLHLPTDYTRQPIQTYNGATIKFTIPENLTTGINDISRKYGATIFMTLLSSFKVLLNKLTGEDDICIGSPIANRNRKEIEGLIGFFVNTLVLRTKIEDNQDFGDILKAVKQTTLDAYSHQDTPFEKLVEELSPDRNMSYSPLFQIMMTLQNIPDENINIGDLKTSPFEIESEISKFDLSLNLEESENILQGSFEYNTDLFKKDTISRLIKYYLRILEAITKNSEIKIADIELIDEEEKHKLLIEWNNTKTDLTDKYIHQLFELQVAKTPDNIAVVFQNKYLNYSELNVKANQLAHTLINKGVKSESVVAIVMNKSIEMITAILAVMKSGGAYLPIDPKFPDDRIGFILDDSNAKIILTQAHLFDKLKNYGSINSKIINLNDSNIYYSKTVNPDLINKSSDLAYIIYTSGSTGHPKGVMIEHSQIGNHIHILKKSLAINEPLNFSLLASYTFDASIEQIFIPLTTGGKLYLPSEEESMDAYKFWNTMEREQINVIDTVPAYMDTLLDTDSWKVCDKVGNKNFIIGGDVFSKELLAKLRNCFPDARIYNTYGPTETTINATEYKISDNVIERTVPIGKPLPGYKCYILDSNGKLLPQGIPGELCIGGIFVARGYLNRPELTAEKFISHLTPALSSGMRGSTSERIYRTGDLARWLPDGNIEYLGRIDTQVKIRGFRIECGEIEAILIQNENIKESVAVQYKEPGRKNVLVAYIVFKDTENILTSTDLRGILAKQLPDYMIPSYFVQMDKLPLNSSGKIDRRALPKPDKALGGSKEYVAPQNETEEKLVKIWSEILKVEKIGIYDNFFELGGHSLLATQVISRIRETFNSEIPVRALFESPTIEGLAKSLSQAVQTIAPDIIPVSRDESLPLSYAQERLWFLDQLEPDSAGYNIPGALRISGELNVSILEQSFTHIIDRHENLRTVFKTENGKPVQIIKEPEYFHIPVINLSNETYKDALAKQLAIAEATAPFNLSQGPLLRAKLIKLSENEHILIINMHHIISDGWSIGILIRELGQVLNSLIKGKQPELQPLPVQYADFSVWQRQWLEAGELERQLSYWKEQLQDSPDLLHLPIDYTRPPVQTYNGSTINFNIPENLTTGINNISRKHGCTTFMTLLSAFNVLLHKLTGENDICVGSPIANRNRKEIEGLIGFFVNTLVLRTKIEEKQSFVDLLNQVKQTTLLSYDHQDTPFEKLVEAISPERDMSYSALFQVMMILQNNPDEAIELGDVEIAPFEIESKTAKFDLTLNLEEADNIMHANIEYNTDLFKPDTISRIIKYYLKVLETITENNEINISDIELIDDEEKHKLLVEWNDTQADYPKNKCIHQLFEEQVSKTPDNIAVVFEDKQLTYSELNSRSNQLAHYLRNIGVARNQIVGLCLERSLEMIISLLGILKTGCTYIPLEPEYPEERLTYMLQDSGTKVLITREHLLKKFSEADLEKICLDKDFEKIEKEDSHNLPTNINTDSLAYVMYTSGSTGKPKGVQIEHRAVSNFLWSMSKTPGFNEKDKLLSVTTFCFDISVLELCLPLINGGEVHILRKEDIVDITRLRKNIETYKPTIMQATPVIWNMLTESGWKNNTNTKILCGGEAFPESLKLSLLKDSQEIWNMFGPTETTIWSMISRVEKNRSVNIGKPIANTQVYILDNNLKILPIGVAGELFIGGDGLSRGYLNREELTKEKFVTNPHTGERMYRTGDLARWLPDGNIEYLGRIDAQVKIRGFRIECGEIENALLQHENIKESLVVPYKEEGKENILVAYIVLRNTENCPGSSDLRETLKKQLPDYMIPSFFINLDSIPLTPNGKIDRRALPKPDKALGGSKEYVAPQNETEEKLVKIWSEILKVEKIGIYDNFFELGGHSLLATQVISRIREIFKTEIPVKAIFESPIIEKLGKILSQFSEAIAPEILPVSREANLPLSYAQERLWFLDQLEPDSAGYNIPGALRISGELNVSILEQSFTHIIERHENLRTVFKTENGKPVQIIREAEYFHIPVTDLSNETDKENKAKQMALSEATTPFNLSQGPLLRAKLIKLSENEHILIINMHHIISDGWSIGILIRELGQVMNSLIKGKQPELQPLSVQYADFSVWQKQWMEAGELERQLSYWKEQLQEAPDLLHLPADYTRPPVQTYNGSTINFSIPENLTTKINNISRKHGCTTFMTLLSAFNVILHKLTGENDICVGSPIANRNRKEIEGLIGFFVNTLVLRTKIEEKKSFADLLNQVKQTTLLSYDHQDTPFEKLVEAIYPERDMSYSPLFQVMMVLQNNPAAAIDLGDVEIAPFEIESKTAKFDLTLNLEEADNILKGNIEYNTDLFKPDTISRIIKYYLKVLETITENNEIKISDIELIDEEEKHKLLVEWNNTKVDYPQDKCIHQLFEEQVAKTPDNIAVIFEDKQLTYRELNEKSNKLAHTLRNKGVKPDSIVAIIAEKSIEMIVAILGVLKAGGAYVPIDPEYPKSRIEFMLKDTGAKLLLTQKYIGENIQYDIEKINLDDEKIYEGKSDNPENINQSRDLMYVMYTSGSTGSPKGVLIEHINAVRLIKNTDFITINETDRILQTGNIVFDATTFEFWGALLNAAGLCIVRNTDILDVKNLGKSLKKFNITVLWLTSPLFNQISEEDERIFADLRYLLVGGDVLSPYHINKVRRRYDKIKILNGYGPTENTTFSTIHEIEHEYNDKIPLGRPISNSTVYIMDKNLKLQPTGVFGELCVGGDGVARGYLNRPELMAEKFVINPYTGERIYRTGDLARWLPDGNIEYLGRIDTQVKIRGFRIECGEIENALLQHENINESLVVPYKEEGEENILVAYIVLKNTENCPGSSDLREMLKKQLPDYMIPSFFINLDSIPLTPNGKVDRRRLPKPDKTIGSSEYVAPQNETEEKLVEIWSEILKIEKIGIYDNFFELGGHSLLATQVISRIRETFKTEIPVKAIFESPTIEGLAKSLSQAVQPIAPEIIPVSRDESLPLSYAQERLWFLDQLEPDSAGYNIPGALRISGELNVSILEQSFTHIIERHENLRTVFKTENGKPIQIIKDPEYFHIPVINLSNETDKDALAKQLAIAEATAPFNLSQGPLLRAKLIKLSENEHILIINMHHIISDGWSIGILIRELGQVLNSLIKGKQPELQPLPVQYADFSVWQRQWLEAGELERQLSYWKEQLQDSPDLLHLPIDYTRPPVQTYNGSTINFNIPENLTTGINNISRKHGCTTFMTLLSAFNVILHKLTGENDISIGSPIANRNRKEIEGLIGFFVNTLVLRSKINDKLSFVEFLNQVKQTTLLSYEHQDTPFEKLVEAISPERDMSYSPLFQVMMILQNNPAAAIDLGDVKIAPFEIESEIAKFDLTLNLEEADNILHANIEYNTDLFKPDTISRIIKYYLKVLETITENNEINISDIELIDDEEKHKLLVEWNDTKSDYPQDKCIHQLFEEQVEKTPDNIAVIFEDKQLTYRELNEKANQLAHYLRNIGVARNQIVGLCLERSLEMIISLLGILKTGCTYIPLEPEYPEERLTYMLQDSGTKVLITREHLLKKFSEADLETICLDKDFEKIEKEDSHNLPTNINSDSLAYVMYTSGSTGKPKGVQIEHRAVSNFLWSMSKTPGFNEKDKLLSVTTFCFDISVLELCLPLINGGEVHILRKEDIVDIPRLRKNIETYKPTIMQATPVIWNMLTESGWKNNTNTKILCGGEAFPESLKLSLLNYSQEIWNMFGPTETTIWSMISRVEKNRSVNIGKPIANTQVYILNNNLKIVPIGVAGELFIGGDGLSRGYLNRPELTAEKFVSHPFDNSPPLEKGAGGINKRMYRTGDLARWLPDGNIEYLGRIDNQVKIRGFRIECGEIENALLQHENIKESLVVPYKEEGKENILVAYIVLKNTENSIGSSDLREILKNQLPDYMIPSNFVQLDKLPLNSNGKVDRKALPKPDKTLSGSREYVAPKNETEEKLVKIWSEILKIEKIGIHDNFFELGGHSLLATQVISRIRETFNSEIPVRALFESPTIEGLAKSLSQAVQTIAPDIIPVSRDESLPLSYAQERLWFLDQLETDSAVYNIPGALRISGEFNVSILEQSFTLIIERHENLRTVFKTENGKPVQIIREAEYFHIPVIDLSNETDKETLAKQMVLSEATAPFNLSQGPLLRAKLIKLQENEHILIINMHHIISDGWSIGILIRELGQVLNSLIKGKQPELHPLPIQYADFAVWQKQWLESGERERQLSYWKEQLSGAPDFLNLPADFSRPPIQTYNGSRVRFTIPASLTLKINEMAQKKGVTLFMLLLSSFNVLLNKLTGDNDICVGSSIANRNRKEIEGLIGFFVNTLVLRTKIQDNQTFDELLNEVRNTTLEAYNHQDIPFENIVNAISQERDMSYTPIFQVMMTLQNMPMQKLNLGDAEITPFDIETETTQFDLILNLQESENELKAYLKYNTDLFRQDTISRMIKYYLRILETVAENKQAKIADIELLDAEEKNKLLLEWNDTKAACPEDKCIHQLFEEQVKKYPDNIAVAFKGQQLTYRELNAKANRLAHNLRSNGVKPDSIIQVINDNNLVLLNKGTNKEKNIFLIHDGTGEVEGYLEFCKHLNTEINCWGIRADRLKNYAPENKNITDIASKYIEKMKKVQPYGPYSIAGWSLGGTIAFEIISQLEKGGENVNLFAMFDSPPPLTMEYTEKFTIESELELIKKHLPGIITEKITGISELNQIWTILIDYLENNNYDINIIRNMLGESLIRTIPNSEKAAVRDLIYYFNVIRTYDNARAFYVPSRKINTQLYHFSANASKISDRELWNKYCSHDIKEIEIDGDHFSIFQEPYVLELAKKINRLII